MGKSAEAGSIVSGWMVRIVASAEAAVLSVLRLVGCFPYDDVVDDDDEEEFVASLLESCMPLSFLEGRDILRLGVIAAVALYAPLLWMIGLGEAVNAAVYRNHDSVDSSSVTAAPRCHARDPPNWIILTQCVDD